MKLWEVVDNGNVYKGEKFLDQVIKVVKAIKVIKDL
jgi:hypothetical protein